MKRPNERKTRIMNLAIDEVIKKNNETQKQLDEDEEDLKINLPKLAFQSSQVDVNQMQPQMNQQQSELISYSGTGKNDNLSEFGDFMLAQNPSILPPLNGDGIDDLNPIGGKLQSNTDLCFGDLNEQRAPLYSYHSFQNLQSHQPQLIPNLPFANLAAYNTINSVSNQQNQSTMIFQGQGLMAPGGFMGEQVQMRSRSGSNFELKDS